MSPPTPPELPPPLAAALADAAAALRDPAGPLELALRRVCELSAAALALGRVSVWVLTEAGRTLHCLTVLDRSRGEFSRGATLRTADFPAYFAALHASASVPAADAQHDARTSELTDAYLTPLGIAALLDAPIMLAGAVLGVLCLEHVGGPRQWTAEERRYAEALTPPLASRLGSVEGLSPPRRERAQLDKLAAGVAHDFKNLLTVIRGYAALVASRAALAPADRDALRHIVEAAERGGVLAGDLMLVASDQPRRTRVISPTRVIEAALPLLRSLVGPRHELHFEARAHDGRVFLDPSSLERVVTNLVLNARDASPGGGPVTVCVQGDVGPPDDTPGRPYMRIEVSDRGTGIDPAVIDRLFEPFVSTKPSDRGTGLGLAIVQQIVDRAGGTIRVKSVLGEGTTFAVYLPRISADAAPNS